MNRKLKEKIDEAYKSVFPISIIVLLLGVFLVSVPVGDIMLFLIGAAMLILGMGFFSLGSDMSMMPMGEGIGVQFTKTKKLFAVIALCFGMGVLITVAEPDLQVLARQTPGVPNSVIIVMVAIGVGIFMVISILRILFRISLSKMLVVFYAIVFAVSFFAPGDFVPLAFDSGGVTTGPITVPFIMAFGLGVSRIRSDKDSDADSFGLVGLCSIGPILMLLLTGIVYKPSDRGYSAFSRHDDVETIRDAFKIFALELPEYFKEVLFAIGPIVVFFVLFQLAVRRYKRRQLLRIAIGFIYTLIGLVLFLTGVGVGFIPVGHLVGYELAGSSFNWVLVPIGFLVGYFIVMAEPAVHVLNKQVEDVSGGQIPGSVLMKCLSIGVAASVAIAMVRVLTGISIYWFLIPGYAIAVTITFFVSKIFTGVAFDSGGVASGPMTSTFLLPFAIGACEGAGGNVMTDAFGVVAMVAMTPILAIQTLGIIYGRRAKIAAVKEAKEAAELAEAIIDSDDDIVEYSDESIVDYDGDDIRYEVFVLNNKNTR